MAARRLHCAPIGRNRPASRRYRSGGDPGQSEGGSGGCPSAGGTTGRTAVAHGFEAELFTDLAAATEQANQWHAEGRLRTLVGAAATALPPNWSTAPSRASRLRCFRPATRTCWPATSTSATIPRRFCRTIAEGVVARVDAGLANDRIFLLMASCGFDADVVRRVHERRVGHISFSTYLKPIAEAIWSYEFPEIRVHWNEGGGNRSQGGKEGDTRPPCERLLGVDAEASVPLSARWLFVFNLPCYGGGFRIAPQADGSDGLFDVCSLRRGGCGTACGMRPACWRGSTIGWPTAPSAACDGCGSLRTPRVPYQLDGDPGGFLPLDIEMLPGRLTLVVPKRSRERLILQR